MWILVPGLSRHFGIILRPTLISSDLATLSTPMSLCLKPESLIAREYDLIENLHNHRGTSHIMPTMPTVYLGPNSQTVMIIGWGYNALRLQAISHHYLTCKLGVHPY
jgi:hypothetical protein